MQHFHATKQPLDSRQLLALATLARTRNFTLAGKELFLSQSAISHALKALEGDVGCRLFDRLRKKAHLTPAGEQLLHYANKILGDMGAARESLGQLARWGKGRLRIASSESIHQFIFPPVLLSFQKDFSEWPVSVTLADTHRSVELLRQNEIDLAIVIAPSRAEPVDVVPLFIDEIVWIVSPEHPWAKCGRVAREEISAQKFILNNAGSYTFRLLDKYFQRDGIRLNSVFELGNLEAIKQAVKCGLGVTALSHWAAAKELADKTLVALPLGKRKLKRNWCVLRSLDRQPNLAEETLVKLCCEAARSLATIPSADSVK